METGPPPPGPTMTRTERTYYLVSGGYNLAQFFLVPVYPLFLLSRGLDLFQVGVVLAVYLITVFCFEIPTGAVADRFGRKVSFVSACVVRTGAFALYAFATSFADCLVAEVIDAIGTTLASGALDAWAVDGVRAEGDRRPPDRMFARAQVIAHTTMIGGGITCAYVAEAAIERPWLVAAAIFGTTGLVAALVMREAPTAVARGRHASLAANTRAAVAAVRGSAPLQLLCFLTAANSFALFPVWQYWQPRIFALGGGSPSVTGWVLALINLAALVGSALLPRLLGRAERSTVLCAAGLWRSLFVGLAGSTGRFGPTVAALALQATGSGLTDPVLAAWTNEHVGSGQRATVLSIRSTFFTFGGAAGLVLLGIVARAAGIPTAWTLAAAVLALAASGYLVLGRIARVSVRTLDVEILSPPAKTIGPVVG